MSKHEKFFVLDHTGAVAACYNEAAPAVKLAEWYAKNFGVADVVCGKRRKRFLASGAAFTVKEQKKRPSHAPT